MNILDKITEKMKKFMRGRNGLDELTILLIYLSTFVLLFSYIPGMEWLMAVSFALYLLSVYRTLSGNTYSCRMEFNIYLKYKNRVLRNIRSMKRKYADRKTHRYYRCRICGCVMRVPKFKGKIEITCPQCRNSIIKKRKRRNYERNKKTTEAADVLLCSGYACDNGIQPVCCAGYCRKTDN